MPTLLELRQIAKNLKIKGYSKLSKKELESLILKGKDLKLRINEDAKLEQHFASVVTPSGWVLSEKTKIYLNKIFNNLAKNLEKENPDFIKSLGYLGQEALARQHDFTKTQLIPSLSLKNNNILLYIAHELFDLAQYAEKPLTPLKLQRIIHNDVDLKAAFKK